MEPKRSLRKSPSRAKAQYCVSEIDAREDSFRATAEAGQMLLDSGHYAAEEVKQKLVILAEEKTSLLQSDFKT